MKAHTRINAVISALAALALIAGCGTSNAGGNNSTIEVLYASPTPQLSAFKDLDWVSRVEKACGCTIKWSRVEGNAWGQQRPAMLNSGTVPDITIRGFGAADTRQFSDFFADLAPHLDDMPNVKEFLTEDKLAKAIATSEDGTILGIPSKHTVPNQSGDHMMINKTWLDKLGLEIPTTWNELLDVLKAFKTQDPNGNGKADEIPMNVTKINTDGFGWYSPMLLLNSTGLLTSFSSSGPSQQGIYLEDGTVKNFLTDERYRQVIEYYHTLYEDQLIPQDALTDDTKTDARNGGDNGTAIVGVAFGWDTSAFGTLADEYVAMPVPASEDGVTPVWDWNADYQQYNPARLTVSKAAANDSAKSANIWKIVNALYDRETSIEQFYGNIPEYVTKDGDHQYTQSEKVFDLTKQGQRVAAHDGAYWLRPDDTITSPEMQSVINDDKAYDEQYANIDLDAQYMPIYVILSDATDQVTVSNNNTQILDYAIPKLASWIAKGVTDAQWDEYVKQVTGLGIDENNAIWQKYYDKAKSEIGDFSQFYKN
ncbi:extracellular solute-binding protein [Bifidobacterium sp. 82T10]|uniref:Extracellular solute-binding protein n=1 Tax=Bifidobacterium miconis TaxID=2834435 RepID=A0ABS6WFR2_9BIFI|nr:extracellular solute-binding protein [Bifidobacterium miconis]MBW3092712.1 extracellular solute-binding protein [Bifidobacterium miconis]